MVRSLQTTVPYACMKGCPQKLDSGYSGVRMLAKGKTSFTIEKFDMFGRTVPTICVTFLDDCRIS